MKLSAQSAQPFCEGARVFRYAAVLLVLLSWPAIAEVHLDYTFSQWEKLQDDDRSAYVAGLIDSLETMAATEAAQRTAQHYSQCLMRSRLTARELADFLREYVRARPEMQGTSVPRAINDYLNVLCGRPFDRVPSHLTGFWLLFVDATRKAPAAATLTDAEAVTMMKSHAWCVRATCSGAKLFMTRSPKTSPVHWGKEESRWRGGFRRLVLAFAG